MHHRFHGIGHEPGGIAAGGKNCRDKNHCVKRKEKTPHKHSPYPNLFFWERQVKGYKQEAFKKWLL
jgi:hypothetical protein